MLACRSAALVSCQHLFSREPIGERSYAEKNMPRKKSLKILAGISITLICLLLLTVCSSCCVVHDLPTRLKSEPLSGGFGTGKSPRYGTIPNDSPAVETIEKILRKKYLWWPSIISYAPVVKVRGLDFSLVFLNGRIVANVGRPGTVMIQVETGLTTAEYEQIRKAIEESMLATDNDHDE